MLGMAIDSARRFLRGELFQDTPKALRQLGLGAGAGALVTVLLGLVAPAWLAALAGGAVAGFLQPILFRDLKYA